MKFNDYRDLLQKSFLEKTRNATQLFEVEVDKDELWSTYLESFAPEYNRIFRERREHDCSCCRSFIRNIGNAVVIENNKIVTMWDFRTDDKEYQPVIDAMSAFIKSKAVCDVYIARDKKVGISSNKELMESGKIHTWEHLSLDIPKKFLTNSNLSDGDLKGSVRDNRNVFKRSLEEITEDSLLTVLELIASNSLYKGEEWKQALEVFLGLKREYASILEGDRDNYAWVKSTTIHPAVAKLRNKSMGTLLIDISEGLELETAVRKFEALVAPSNYKRPNAIFTKKMLDNAKKTIESLGYTDSLPRRFATLDDIRVNNILFSNKDSAKRIGGMNLFEEMAQSVPTKAKDFSKVESISIDKFIVDVLPTVQEVEVLLENKHLGNMVSLIAPKNKESDTMFKWDNGFGWAYSGNITDSMKENVKSAGGSIDGDLRFSIQWNDIGDVDRVDLDAHCLEPGGNVIYYRNKRSYMTNGILDVDITSPRPNVPAVENITWVTRKTMKAGEYTFMANDFSGMGLRNGFRAEIEFDGQVYSFDCPVVKRGEKVIVATVTLKSGVFTIKENLKSSASNREAWGVTTNNFVPVSVVMHSPNYWNKQEGIGNKHYFFMMKDCVNSEKPNGFYNEFLREDLMEHKKVFEAIGGKMAVESVEDQLSGLGFSSTKRNDLIVRVVGQTQRVMKIKF